MRLGRTIPSVVFSLLATFVDAEPAAGNGSLDPPGLQPLIARANVLLSSGQFGEAARTYTEAIGSFFLWQAIVLHAHTCNRAVTNVISTVL